MAQLDLHSIKKEFTQQLVKVWKCNDFPQGECSKILKNRGAKIEECGIISENKTKTKPYFKPWGGYLGIEYGNFPPRSSNKKRVLIIGLAPSASLKSEAVADDREMFKEYENFITSWGEVFCSNEVPPSAVEAFDDLMKKCSEHIKKMGWGSSRHKTFGRVGKGSWAPY